MREKNRASTSSCYLVAVWHRVALKSLAPGWMQVFNDNDKVFDRAWLPGAVNHVFIVVEV